MDHGFTDTFAAVDHAPSGRAAAPAPLPQGVAGQIVIGDVQDISGSSSVGRLEIAALNALENSTDPTLQLAGSIGSQVKMKVGKLWLLANVRDMKIDRREPGWIVFKIDFLGEGEEGADGNLENFRRGVTRYPRPGDLVYAVRREDLVQAFAANDRPHIEIGTIYPTTDVRAALFIDSMLGKHFALLGSTGTGKSTSTALILHKIVEKAPQGHIVMLDPHGEYAAAFSSTGMIFNVDNMNIPYWLMNFEEHCEVFITTEGSEREMDMDILAKCVLQARAKNRLAQSLGKLTVDSPVPYLLSDLLASLQAQMGKLDKANDLAPYMRLKTKVEELKNDPRYTFMFSGLMVSDTMAAFLARVLRLPGDGKPISIVDLSGVPSDIVTVVVAVLSRMVFDYALWSRNEPQRPILLVCEEAHRYVPSDRVSTGVAVRKVLERIAKEGRKYGVSLGLITQRPSDLAEGVLSQCGTIISMRLNNDRDQAYVRNAMPEGARGFLDSIPALRNRECIICGEGVSIPIRVRLDDLAPHLRPASDDPLFSQLWTEVGGEEQILERTIHRWRSQGR